MLLLGVVGEEVVAAVGAILGIVMRVGVEDESPPPHAVSANDRDSNEIAE